MDAFSWYSQSIYKLGLTHPLSLSLLQGVEKLIELLSAQKGGEA